jgi:hypothetical protein
LLADVLQAEGFENLAGGVSVVLGGGEVAEAEVDAGELEERRGFAGWLPRAFLIRRLSSNEREGGLKLRRAAGSSPCARAASPSSLADDADVLGGLAEAALVFQVHGQLPGFLIPGACLGQTACVQFDYAERVVGLHHRP